eukprot:CAMPEP_0117515442 /NCGR_PEP_ID=MMETSP0784-20121206/30584_1 /TAXON_ID=39447 /ORGANISM="" /LENGTH=415 /DNA_ID=CAMNT_0005311263 /DNA_START=118 /DNA_END=1362 /DNA_ORIENTATION=-
MSRFQPAADWDVQDWRDPEAEGVGGSDTEDRWMPELSQSATKTLSPASWDITSPGRMSRLGMPEDDMKITMKRMSAHADGPRWKPSTVVATLPLEHLPKASVQEADFLLSEGDACVAARLKDPVVSLALHRQGVQAADILAAVAASAGHQRSRRSPVEDVSRRSGSGGVDSNPRALRQLLAQVLCETSLCASARNGTDGQGDMSHASFSRSPQMNRVRGTQHPISRPLSAQAARLRIASDWNEYMGEQHAAKDRNLANAASTKGQRLDEISDRKASEHWWKETRTAAFKDAECQRHKEYVRDYWMRDMFDTRRVQNLLDADRIHARSAWGPSASAKQEAAASKRHFQANEHERVLHNMTANTEAAHVEAAQRRRRVDEAKSLGPPQLRQARDLASWQNHRLERVRELHRRQLQER